MSHNTSFISNSQEHPAENRINPYNFHDNRPRSALGEWGGVGGAGSPPWDGEGTAEF